MLQSIKPFRPETVIAPVAVGTTTANVQINTRQAGICVRLVNSGTNVIFVSFGNSTVAATTTGSVAMLPNTERVFFVQGDNQYMAYISGATGNTLYITTGESI